MARRAAPAWLLPLIVLGLGSLMITSAALQQARVQQHLERRARAHVVSVSTVLAQSTRQTAEAVDLAYLMLEARLHASLLRVGGAPPSKRSEVAREEALQVWRLRGDKGDSGEPGPMGVEDLEAAWAKPAETLFEVRTSTQSSFACLVDEHYGIRSLACIDGEELSRLRGRAGPGRLFAGIMQAPLLYVAIEDEEGVIAASPGLPKLSDFAEDPELSRVTRADLGTVLIRQRPGLREGLSPFELPDGTRVVLRVGLDAQLEEGIRADLVFRQRRLVAGVVLAVLLASLGAWWLVRRQRSQAEVEQTLERMEAESEHWRMIGQLAATVAHEVRNPLNAVQMAAQRLSKEFEVPPDDQPEYHALLGMLRSEGARVEAVVTEFLELGRPLVLQRRSVDSAQALGQALAPLEARAEAEGKRLQIQGTCAQPVRVDSRRLVQIVDNLVRNALDATPVGGAVQVRTSCDDEGLSVVVDDEGPGMAPETLAQVMDPFFTTKARGTGLGLPLARRLAQAHGGQLLIRSTPGQGTQAHLHIPHETSEETL